MKDRGKSYNVRIRTKYGSTILCTVAASDMADALKEVTNIIVKGGYQSSVDYSNAGTVEINEVSRQEGV